MKIAFNPSMVAALITPPNNKDITFDLRGHNIFARGVKFCGTDTNTWRDIKINNVSIDSNTLDLRDGDNTTLTNINGVVTINSTWRPVVDNLTSDSTTSSLTANQGRILKALIDGKSDSDHNHDDRYLKLTGGWMSGALTIDFNHSGGGTTSSLLNVLFNGTHDYGIVAKFHSYGGDSPAIRFSHSSNKSEYNSQVNTNWSVGMRHNTYTDFAITQDRGTSGWGTVRFAINNSGNVGIGINSASYKLHVAGDIYSTEYVRASSGFVKGSSSDSYVLLGGGGHKLESSLNVAHATTSGRSWDVPIQGQHWSRLYVGIPNTLHHSSIFSIRGSIGCVVFCQTFLVESNHPGSATIICLFSSSYTQPKMRALAKSDGTVLVDLFWSGSDCSQSSSTQQMTINVIANALQGSISPITTLTNDDTIPNGYSNTCEFQCTSKTSNFYNIRAAGNSYATHFYESSDKALKKNIKSILSSTNIPKIREFDWKDTGEHSYGFIAQELEEQGYGCLVSEADGKKTVNYTATLALTVAKLQNLINIQNKKISNLTKELKALKYGRKKNS